MAIPPMYPSCARLAPAWLLLLTGTWLLLALTTHCAGAPVGHSTTVSGSKTASVGVSHEQAAFLFNFCRTLVSSSPSASPATDSLQDLSQGGDIVFNVTIDAPALTLPNLQLAAHNFDVDLSVSRIHVPMVNYAAYGGLLTVQLFTFVLLMVGYLCVVRPLQRQVLRLHAVMAKHDLVNFDDDDQPDASINADAGDYAILEKDGVRYDQRRVRGSQHEQLCEGCGQGCPADAHFCSCCGRPLSFPRSGGDTAHALI